MSDKFIPTRNSFVLTSTNVWTKLDDWTELQSVWQTWNCFDLTVSSIEIDEDLIIRFRDAASEGDVSTVEELLRAGVPVDIVVDDRFDLTTLMPAALRNRTDIIRLLLQNGANVNKQNHLGYRAAVNNNPEAIALLVKHGALMNITNNDGYKPIDVARWNNNEATVRMLEQL